MEGALVYIRCNKRGCKYQTLTIHGGLSFGNNTITQAGPLLSHLLLHHPEFDLNGYMMEIRSSRIICLKQLNVIPCVIEPSEGKTHYVPTYFVEGYIWMNDMLSKSLQSAMKGTSDIMLECLDSNLDGTISAEIFSQFIILVKEEGESESINIPQITMYPGLKIVAVSSPFASVTMYNSWSTGRICNIIDKNLALVDLKLVHGSSGCPVFKFKKGKKKELIGLVVSNVLRKNQELTGFSFVALLPMISGNLQKMETSVSKTLLVKHPFDNERVVQIITDTTWGSGIVIGDKGLIVTSAHVLSFGECNANIRIKTHEQCYNSKILFCTKRSASFQFAVLEIIKNNEEFLFKAVPLATRQPKIGESVNAVGYNLLYNTFQPSVCRGVIRAKSEYFFTTTCTVHCGCSGGAIINKNGELIGIINANLKGEFIYPAVNFAMSVVPLATNLLSSINENNYTSLTDKIYSLPLDIIKLEFKTAIINKNGFLRSNL